MEARRTNHDYIRIQDTRASIVLGNDGLASKINDLRWLPCAALPCYKGYCVRLSHYG